MQNINHIYMTLMVIAMVSNSVAAIGYIIGNRTVTHCGLFVVGIVLLMSVIVLFTIAVKNGWK